MTSTGVEGSVLVTVAVVPTTSPLGRVVENELVKVVVGVLVVRNVDVCESDVGGGFGGVG